MSNHYTGEVSIELGGAPCRLVYDWRAIAEIQTVHTAEVLANLFAIDPVSLASMLAIGLRKHNPDMTQERILDLSPPLLAVQTAIDKAFGYAYYGPDHFKKLDEQPADAKADKPKKKTR